MPIPTLITNYVERAIQLLTRQFRKPKIEGLFATTASSRVMVTTVADSTLYTITINGTPVDFTSGLLATDIVIAAGLVTQVNLAALGVSAKQETDTGNLFLFPDTAGIDFTVSVTTNLVTRRTAFIDQVQELEFVFNGLLRQRGLLDDGSGNRAEGEQLDGIGRNVGLSREPGQDDATYRDLLTVQVVRNRSHGEPERLIQVLIALTGTADVDLVEYFPGLVIMTFGGVVVNNSRLLQIMDSLAAAGVRLDLVHAEPPLDEVFAFDGGDGLGFDEGRFAGTIS